MSLEEKLARMGSLRRSLIAVASAGIRAQYPNADQREVFLRLAQRTLGRDLARKAYPEIEALERG